MLKVIQQIVAYDILEVHRVQLTEIEKVGRRLRALPFCENRRNGHAASGSDAESGAGGIFRDAEHGFLG